MTQLEIATTGVELYLDLLKKVLINSIYQDSAFAQFGETPRSSKDESDTPAYNESLRTSGRDWPKVAHTMVGRERLDNVHQCLDQILADDIAGDCIETGVWRGGVCIFIRGFLKAHGCDDRIVWLADSFEGLPDYTSRDITPEDVARAKSKGISFADTDDMTEILKAANKKLKDVNERVLGVTEASVRENFRRYDLLDDQVRFLPGWFRNTLHDAPIDKLALLRLDGDFYDSTTDSLENLYHKVSIGGFVIIDDFAIPACQRAVEDFRNKNDITEPVHRVDHTGVYWRKER